jgi:hypothetical protein
MGNGDLADVLWRFSKSHLRLALLAAEVYNRMMKTSDQGRKHRDEIAPMAQRWVRAPSPLSPPLPVTPPVSPLSPPLPV